MKVGILMINLTSKSQDLARTVIRLTSFLLYAKSIHAAVSVMQPLRIKRANCNYLFTTFTSLPVKMEAFEGT